MDLANTVLVRMSSAGLKSELGGIPLIVLFRSRWQMVNAGERFLPSDKISSPMFASKEHRFIGQPFRTFTY